MPHTGGTMIVSTPGTLGGKPRIDGHRIGVDHVASWYHDQGWSVETIMEKFGLTRAEVQAALEYYDAHAEAINARTRADEAHIESIRHATRRTI